MKSEPLAKVSSRELIMMIKILSQDLKKSLQPRVCPVWQALDYYRMHECLWFGLTSTMLSSQSLVFDSRLNSKTGPTIFIHVDNACQAHGLLGASSMSSRDGSKSIKLFSSIVQSLLPQCKRFKKPSCPPGLQISGPMGFNPLMPTLSFQKPDPPHELLSQWVAFLLLLPNSF